MWMIVLLAWVGGSVPLALVFGRFLGADGRAAAQRPAVPVDTARVAPSVFGPLEVALAADATA